MALRRRYPSPTNYREQPVAINSTQKIPKKVVVKTSRFPYLSSQMHRIGSRVKRRFTLKWHVLKKYNKQKHKQPNPSRKPDEV